MKVIRFLHWTHLPMEQKAREKMNDELFREYVSENGYHFNCALSNYVSGKMKAKDANVKPWTTKEVDEALESHGVKRPSHITLGDAAYVMNMAKMDFHPNVLTNIDSIIKYTDAVMHDPDGYDGMIFGRWLSDDLFKDDVEDWDAFI